MGIFGAALGAAGSIAGGLLASKAAKKVQKNIEAQKRQNQNWYDRRYNEDATQRADAQAALTAAQDEYKTRNRQSAGTQAVMGGTDESVAAEKAANANALASATSAIAVNADARKDKIEQQYQVNDAAYQDKLNNIEQSKANAIGQAVQGVAQVGASMPF